MSALTDRLTQLAADVKRTADLVRIEPKRQRLAEIEDLMSQSDFWQDRSQAEKVAREAAELREEVDQWHRIQGDVASALELAEQSDDGNDRSLDAELEARATELVNRFRSLEFTLLLSGSHDRSDAVIAIYAGAGGVDAQDWAEMLARMYIRYAERRGWQAELVEQSRGTEAGLKSATVEVHGRWAYGYLQGEHGVHRLVRLSPFNADHARHTSFAMVEVLPSLEEAEVEVKPEDVKVETKTASGHGGQSVNTTYSAVRLTHVPTGITVQCQDERSQLQNRERAMRYLRGKLERYYAAQREEERQALRGERTEAAWGNHIRSYVLHPYQQVREHRSDYEEPNPTAVLDGAIDGFLEHYLRARVAAAPP